MSTFNIGDKVRILKSIAAIDPGYTAGAEGQVVALGGGTSEEFQIGVRVEGSTVTHYFSAGELESALHLWEVEHDYSGPHQNYHLNYYDSQDYFKKHDSWDSFYEENKDNIVHLNVLWRWDWRLADAELEEPERLELFWIQPRRGTIASDTVYVKPEDEPAVREYLKGYADYLKGLWSPLL